MQKYTKPQATQILARTAHSSAHMTVHNLWQTIQHRTVLIIFHLTSRQSSLLRYLL